MKRILFLTPYPSGTAGSQRFRFEQYIPLLEKEGVVCDTQSFIDEETWRILYLPGHTIAKLVGVIKGFARRKWLLLKVSRYDFVFIHREVTPIGPPIFEWILAKVLKKKIIYDFDDAIWKENTTGSNAIAKIIKWSSKVGSICSWSLKVSVGNEFLASYARQFNNQVLVNPTTIDTNQLHLPSEKEKEKIVIGWTGTHSTLRYIELLSDVINKVAEVRDIETLIIADQKPISKIIDFKFLPWEKNTEINDLNKIDIGLMPLEDDEWAKGKCGFKALQFMALEKPVLVSPVGVNANIIAQGVSGYHCVSPEDWESRLIELIDDQSLRKRMGKAGREKVIEEYSVESNSTNFMSLFDSAD